MITPEQLRMARARLNFSQTYVAEKIGIAHTTLSKIEKGEGDTPTSRLRDLRNYYEAEGLEFTDDNGVRDMQITVQKYRGAEGFRAFMDDVYQTAVDTGGGICLFNAKPSNWHKWLGHDWWQMHSDRMAALGDKIHMRITAKEGENLLISSSFAEYRWFPSAYFSEQSFYVYGEKIAFLNFSDEDVSIVVINQKEFTKSLKDLFDIGWEYVAITPGNEVENAIEMHG